MRRTDEAIHELIATFDEIMSMEPDARAARLNACEPGLRDEVSALLHHVESGEFDLVTEGVAPLRDLVRRLVQPTSHREAEPDEEALRRRREALRARLPLVADRYEVHERVGEGGMATVHRALDRLLRRWIAMKVIRRPIASMSSYEIERCSREAESNAKLDHPAIVPLLDIARDSDDRVFFTMKLLEHAQTLQAVIHEFRGDLRTRTAKMLPILLQVADAVAFAHGKDILHRDISTTNIMVGDRGEAYVMDWGIARMLDASENSSEGSVARTAADGMVATRAAGTPGFMAPERRGPNPGQHTRESDVYSLGAVLHVILYGCTPPESDAGPPAHAASQDARDRAPAELRAICQRALAHEPSARYAKVDEFADDMRAFLGGYVVAAYATPAWMRLAKALRRHSRVVAVCLLIVAATLGGSVAWLQRRDSLATEAYENGVSASRRGNQEAALSSLIEARRLGYHDDIAISLELVDLLDAKLDADGVDRELERLGATPETSPHRGRWLLLRSDPSRLPVTHAIPARCIEGLEAAMATGELSPADASYAKALLAETTVEVREHLDEALGHDPTHRRAWEMRISTLLLTARVEAAVDRARELLLTRPGSRSAQTLLVGCLAIRFHDVPRDMSMYPEVDPADVLPLTGLLAIPRVFNDLAPDIARARSDRETALAIRAGNLLADALTTSWWLPLAPSGLSIHRIYRMPPRPTREWLRGVALGVRVLHGGPGIDPELVERMNSKLDRLIDDGAGGFLSFLRAHGAIALGEYDHVTEHFANASLRPALVPIERLARIFAIGAARTRGSVDLTDEIIEVADAMASAPQLSSAEFHLLWRFYTDNRTPRARWRSRRALEPIPSRRP